MKSLTLLFFILSMPAFAKLQCPDETGLILSCTESSQEHDSLVATQYMNEVIVCGSNDMIGMIVGRNDKAVSELVRVRETVRMGTTSYQASADGVEFSLVRSPGPKEFNGRFSITSQGKTFSRTLSCE